MRVAPMPGAVMSRSASAPAKLRPLPRNQTTDPAVPHAVRAACAFVALCLALGIALRAAAEVLALGVAAAWAP